MAAKYAVTFRNDDEWDIEGVDYFSSSDGLLFAAAENSDVVAVFPIASLMGIVRLDGDEDDGDDGKSADEARSNVYNITNYPPGFPPRMQSKVG